jgi:hypothetical protein
LADLVGGAFAITVVPAMLVVQDDLAATAHNIQAHELLYRSGLAAHLVVTTTNVFLAVIFYELFKRRLRAASSPGAHHPPQRPLCRPSGSEASGRHRGQAGGRVTA